MKGAQGIRLVRRASLTIIAAVLAAGALGVPAGATPPDLTGSWINPQAPPYVADWSLQSSVNKEGLSADWHGTQAQGHPTLRGHFFGTLDQAGDAYMGRYKVTESGTPPSGGNMTITVNSPDQFTADLYPDAGGHATYQFDRAAASATPPATAWCANADSPDQGCQTDATTMAPGSEAVEPSADFTSGEDSATVEVASSDPSATDLVEVTPPPHAATPIHAADCVKVAGAVVKGAGNLRVDLNMADWDQIRSESGGPNAVLFAYALLACLDVVHAQDAAPGSAADIAKVTCPVSAQAIKITHESPRSVTFTARRGQVKPPLLVSCTRKNGKLVMHIRTRSKRKTLRQILGKRLLVGVYYSSKASKIEMARIAFANH